MIDGKEIRTRRADFLRFSPDGSRVAFIDDVVKTPLGLTSTVPHVAVDGDLHKDVVFAKDIETETGHQLRSAEVKKLTKPKL